MKDVFSYTKCPFVILLDEWDCLFREYKQDKEASVVDAMLSGVHAFATAS